MNKYNIIGIYVIIILIIFIYYKKIEMFEETYNKEGDELYQLATGIQHGEHSRFNYKTKECSHWYCLQVMDNIL